MTPLFGTVSPNGGASAASGGGAAGLVFHADWSTATGSTDAALRDTGKAVPFTATTYFGPGVQSDVFAVIPNSQGFPQGMTNILQVTRSTKDDGGYIEVGDTNVIGGVSIWPQLGIGDTNFWRLYLLVTCPDSQPNNGVSSHHPFDFPPGTDEMYPGNFLWRNDGTISWQTVIMHSPADFHLQYSGMGPTGTDNLPKNKVLRVEWMFRRDGSTTGSFYQRIYDATGEASGGAASLMYSEDGVGASLGAVRSQSSPYNTLKQNDAAYSWNTQGQSLTDLTAFGIGPNGNAQGYTPSVHYYIGGVCMRTNTWCGAYSGGI